MLRKHVGILSLSEDVSNPLLWAHYADAHKGLALEFEAHHAYFERRRSDEDDLYHLRPVTYAHRTSEGRTLSDLDGNDLLVTKAPTWSYEAEWRMLVPLADSARMTTTSEGDRVYLFPIPLSAVKAVVLGARASETLVNRVNLAVSSSEATHIELLRAVLDQSDQRITIRPA